MGRRQEDPELRAARQAWAARERARVAAGGKKNNPPPFNFRGKKISIGDERHPEFVGPKKPLGVGDTIGGPGGMKIIGVQSRAKKKGRAKAKCGGRVKAKDGGRMKRAKVLSRGKRR